MTDAEKIKECKSCKEQKCLDDFYFKDKKNNRYDTVCKKCRIKGNTIPTKINTGTKVCKHCNIEKPYSEYQKAGGGRWLQPYCKPCDSERKKIYGKLNQSKVVKSKKCYYEENKDAIKKKNKEYLAKNYEAVKERLRRYNDKNKELKRQKGREYIAKNREILKKKSRERYFANHEYNLKKQKLARDKRTPEQLEAKRKYDREYKIKNAEKIKAWKERNKDKIREQKRINSNKKAATDIQYRLKRNLRTRIRCALKPNNAYKVDRSENLLGCSIEFYKKYLQNLFTEGMSWDRFMNGEIEIDHKTPCVKFDLTKESEQRKCFNYLNTQPLWMVDNMKKGVKTMEAWLQQQKIA